MPRRSSPPSFSLRARLRLVELDMSITELAAALQRPRETVGKAIRSARFPRVRAAIAKKLRIEQEAA